MINLLIATYLIPLVTSLLLALPFKIHEKLITRLSTISLLIPAVVSLSLFIRGVSFGEFPMEYHLGTPLIFDHAFPFVLWIDHYTIAMLGLTHLLGLMVVRYSHGYLHLEKGFQRFFSTILLFIFGMYVLCLAGTMDLFFGGWEIVGLSSFLLIAFYRSHNRSVLNAWRVYNIYRICDIGLLLGAVMGHILWHEASRFSVLLNLSRGDFASVNSGGIMVLSLFVIFASLGKSAQFPFHNWPSRAMEGPTPSSAIFYGALSIHAGVFLLLRTFPLWSHHSSTRILVGLIGLATLILSSLQGRVQANIKGQIAYASTAQIGLMFIELSLGFKDLVMIHLVAHALHRCFQMLVSPSIVFNSIGRANEVIMGRVGNQKSFIDRLPQKIQHTLYVLSMSDFWLDTSWRGFGFSHWKSFHKRLIKALCYPYITLPVVLGIILGLRLEEPVPMMLMSAGLFFSVRSILFDHSAFKAMLEMGIASILSWVSVYLLDHQFIHGLWSYMFSIVPFMIIGIMIGWRFRHYDLRNFHSLGTRNAFMANLFFMCFLVLAGMPVSSAFLGEDIILEELILHSHVMTVFMTSILMVNGLVCVKIYTRLFMGLAPMPGAEVK